MAKFNTKLAQIMDAQLEKAAFVPMGPDAQIQQQAQQQAQQQQQAQPQPGADPSAQGAPPDSQPAEAPPADPAAQMQQAPQAQPQPGQPGQSPDDLRAIMREELTAHEEKPKKLPVQERVTQLEGLLLRLMEYQGMIKPDPNLTSNQPAGQAEQSGMAPGAMPQVDPMTAQQPAPDQQVAAQPGMPSAQPGMAKAAAYYPWEDNPLVQSVRQQVAIFLEEVQQEKVAADEQDKVASFGRVAPEDAGYEQIINYSLANNEPVSRAAPRSGGGLAAAAARLRQAN